MKTLQAVLGAAALAVACVTPAIAADASVSSGTGIPITSGTGLMVSPGYVTTQTITVTESNTAVMGAPAGSIVRVSRYFTPMPPSNGYLRNDFERWLALNRKCGC